MTSLPYLRPILITVTSLSIISITVFFFLVQLAQIFTPIELKSSTGSSAKPEVFHITAPRENVWSDLTNTEVVTVLGYVHSAAPDFNLTAALNATLWNDFIVGTEVIRPSKKAALSYITGEAESPPPRYAKIAIHRGTESEVFWDEYSVGPLPISGDTKITPFNYEHRTDLEHARNLVPDARSYKEWPYLIAEQVSDITQDLLDATVNIGDKNDPGGLELSFRDPWVEDGHIMRWCSFLRAGTRNEAGTILPQGLYVKLDTTGRDPGNWKILAWFYNGQMYASTEEFRAAWQSPGFEKLPVNYDGDWTAIEDFSTEVPDRDKPAPIMIHPGNPRYQIDPEARYVSWMGFTFYWSFSQSSGVTLFDVRFKGDRILYELGLQEAMSLYAGNDPLQGALAYFDSFFGMGRAMFELVPGYDCPVYATYFNTTIYDAERTQVRKNTICLFEYTADYPLQRHSTSFYVTVSRNNYLVLRTVAVVGNYDYTVDYIFYLDGAIEIKIRASGYIQGAYFEPGKSQDYGFRVHDAFATSMHDHIINFKADLDILESKNTLMKIDIEPVTRSYPWLEGKAMNTMNLKKSPMENETGLNWPGNSASMYVVGNNGSENSWGETRGYRLMPGSGIGTPVFLIQEQSQPLGKSALWGTKSLWVTKHKESESRSASPRNALNREEPLVDFNQYMDEENIEDEDLVIWFNLGGHHVPHSGDIPNTLQHTSASSIILAPFNFHDRDASRKSSQGVRVDFADEKSNAETKFFGHHYEELDLERTDFLPNLTAYGTEERQVRKFPYTVNNLSL